MSRGSLLTGQSNSNIVRKIAIKNDYPAFIGHDDQLAVKCHIHADEPTRDFSGPLPLVTQNDG